MMAPQWNNVRALICIACCLMQGISSGVEADEDGCVEGGLRECNPKSKYCVIGAGPAGVQMGHFLNKAGMDYAVFERGHRAGTFFSKFPVHRKLNSFNRR